MRLTKKQLANMNKDCCYMKVKRKNKFVVVEVDFSDNGGNKLFLNK